MDIINDFNCYFKILDKNNYFAYLSLTGKNELQFRDNFAYFLNEKYCNSNYVSKEYSINRNNRADLVILDLLGSVRIVIEFKVFYAYNFEEIKIKRIVSRIEDDRSKNCRLKDTKAYYIVLVINPYELPKPKNLFRKIIKYYARIERFIKKYSPENYFEKAKALMGDAFNKTRLKITFSGNKKLGKAFNVECGLYCFILEEK